MQRRRPSHDKIVKHSAPRRVRTSSLRSTINTKSPSAAHFLSLASDWFTVSHHRPWTPRNLGPSSEQLLPHRREVPISSPRSNAPAPAFRLVGVVPSSHSRTLRLVGVFFPALPAGLPTYHPPISVTEHSWTFSPRLLTTVSGSFGLQSNASSQRFEAKTTRVPNRRAGVTVWGGVASLVDAVCVPTQPFPLDPLHLPCDQFTGSFQMAGASQGRKPIRNNQFNLANPKFGSILQSRVRKPHSLSPSAPAAAPPPRDALACPFTPSCSSEVRCHGQLDAAPRGEQRRPRGRRRKRGYGVSARSEK
jgi:hypothetical protein